MKKTVQCIAKNIPLGSILKEDIVSAKGNTLAEAGTKVTSDVYRAIQYYTGEVSIEVEYESAKTDSNSTEMIYEDTSFMLSDDVKERASASLSYIYSSPGMEETVDTSVELADEIGKLIMDSDDLSINLKELKISDDYSFKHSVDVATMAALLCRRMGMDAATVKKITTSGILHDIGKIDVPKEILNAPRRLTDSEFDVIKKHAIWGYDRIKQSKKLTEDVKMGVLQHHEKRDGTGYPLGLSGNAIHQFGKILSVVDVYDALVTKRPYKDGKTPSVALEMMLGMFSQFDIDILRSFMDIVILYPIGTKVLGSDKRVYIVMGQNYGYPLRPIVKDVQSEKVIDLLNDKDYLHLVILSEV